MTRKAPHALGMAADQGTGEKLFFSSRSHLPFLSAAQPLSGEMPGMPGREPFSSMVQCKCRGSITDAQLLA